MVTILTFLNKNGLWISWPFFILGIILLWFFILSAVRLTDKNRICSLPLAAEQSVAFPEAGRVILWLEGPHFTPRFAGLTFSLSGSDGSLFKGRMALMRKGSSNLSKVRIADLVFTIPSAGTYVLHTKGLGEPQPGDEKLRLLFMRPYLAKTVTSVLGIILGAILCIGSIVNFFIRLSQGGGG